jgi:HAD superfamily hydrolase (TIGR01450 family)
MTVAQHADIIPHMPDRDIEAIVLDLHGVLIRCDQVIPGAAEALQKLRHQGIPVAFLTNTSARTTAEIIQVLGNSGLVAKSSEVVTAGRLLARKLSEVANEDTCVIRYGGANALTQEIAAAGLQSIHLHDSRELTEEENVVFVLGYSREFSLREAAELLRLSPNVTNFFAGDNDRWYAAADGPTPGIGWILAAAENVLDRKAEVVGKPSGYGLQVISSNLACPTGKILLVGDSIESDVKAARNAGAMSCLISSRASPEADFNLSDITQLPGLVSLLN